MRTMSAEANVLSPQWKKRTIKKWLLFCLFSALSTQDSALAETTGAKFLKLGDGARPLALGGAYTAMPGDTDSLFYNPGAMAWLARPQLSFTHAEWLEDTSIDALSYGHPTVYGTFGVSAMRLGGGDLEGRDSNRQKTGSFTADDIMALFSYSHSLSQYVGAGANIKYLRSRIDTVSATGVAMDAGAAARLPGVPLWVGGSVLNMGSGLRFEDQVDRLPLTIAVGTVYQPIQPLLVSLDFSHEPYDSRSDFHIGAEYSLSLFDFRIGYVQLLDGEKETSLSAAEHLRGGLGIHWSRYRADYTLAPFGDLGLTQRFSLSVTFGGDAANIHERKNLAPSSAEKPDSQIPGSSR